VPQQSIVFLTRSESDAISLGKEVGAYAGGFVGGAAGLTSGVVAATLFLIPGIGQVFALGIGATALLGLAGAGAGSAVGKAISRGSGIPEPTAEAHAAEDTEFFREVLKQGHSLIVVRTESHETAQAACDVLDRLGPAKPAGGLGKCLLTSREAGGVTILDVEGRITLGEGNIKLREAIGSLQAKGKDRILLNLRGVEFVDSAGIGELVRTYATLRKQGAQMKLVNLNPKVYELLKTTSLTSVFDIASDEPAALKAFGAAQ